MASICGPVLRGLEDLPFLPDVQLLVYVRVVLRDGILRVLLTRLLPERLLLRRHWLCHRLLLSIRRLLLGRIRIMHLATSEWLELTRASSLRIGLVSREINCYSLFLLESWISFIVMISN